MTRLTYEKRFKIVQPYEKNYLHFKKGRFRLLVIIAEAEDIIATSRTMRKIITRWQNTGFKLNQKNPT